MRSLERIVALFSSCRLCIAQIHCAVMTAFVISDTVFFQWFRQVMDLRRFYRASIGEGAFGSRNSVRPSVTRVDCDSTICRTADIFIPHERAITLLL